MPAQAFSPLAKGGQGGARRTTPALAVEAQHSALSTQHSDFSHPLTLKYRRQNRAISSILGMDLAVKSSELPTWSRAA